MPSTLLEEETSYPTPIGLLSTTPSDHSRRRRTPEVHPGQGRGGQQVAQSAERRRVLETPEAQLRRLRATGREGAGKRDPGVRELARDLQGRLSEIRTTTLPPELGLLLHKPLDYVK